MPRISLVICSMIILLGCFACDSEKVPDCFKKTGDIIETEMLLDEFEAIQVEDEVDVYLHNSSEQKVVLKAGRNLIHEIECEVRNKVLTISNNNRCNWRRAPNNPGIHIYSNHITAVSIFDYSNFFTTDTLSLSRLDLYSDGTGNFDMIIDIDSLWIESQYISTFQFAGRVDYLNIYFTNDSRFLGQDLWSNYCEVNHAGSNRVDVFPLLYLKGQLHSTGDLFYYNEPKILEITSTGTGKVINLSD